TVAAYKAAQKLSKQPSNGKLSSAIATVLITYGDENSFDYVADAFEKMPLSQGKFSAIQPFSTLLGKLKNTEKVKRGVDLIVSFRDAIPKQARNQTDPFINEMILKGLVTIKNKAGLQEQADYISSKLP